MKLTYKQAYDKIIDAYFKDEIQPLQAQFCFCGTLHGNNSWYHGQIDSESPYNIMEYKRMENALLGRVKGNTINEGGLYRFLSTPYYEETLFDGMTASLDVLKEIHRSRGEDVDNVSQPFTKRQLA